MKVMIITTYERGCSSGGDIDEIYVIDDSAEPNEIYSKWRERNKDIPSCYDLYDIASTERIKG